MNFEKELEKKIEEKGKDELFSFLNTSRFPANFHEIYQKAIRFAGERHLDQKIPSSEASYVVHISNVAMEIMMAYFVCPDFDLNLAVQLALLHDVIEDTDTSFDDVKEMFGERVANGVNALSKNSAIADKKERMQDSLDRIVVLEREVGMVKLADRITNLQPPPAHWNNDKMARYKKEAELIYDVLKHCNHYLASRLNMLIEKYERYYFGDS